MESPRAQQLMHLGKLAEELTSSGLSAELAGKISKPYLKVANAGTPSLNERVLCQQGDDGHWIYEWPWRQPIGSVDDLVLVVSRVVLVLRSVEADRAGETDEASQ